MSETAKPPIQMLRPGLMASKYELRGRVIEPEHAAGIAKPQAGGIVGNAPGERKADDRKP